MTKNNTYRNMGKAYERAAIKNEWTNEDGSVFPISAANLFKFLKVRAETCTPRTLEGYVSAIAGYQRSYRQMDIDLGALRSDPQIQKLVNKNPKIYRNGSFKTGRKLKKNKKKMIDKVTVEYEYDDPMEMSMNENEYTKARGIVLNDPAVEATENLPILEGKDVGDMEEDPWDSGQDAEGEDEISPNDQSESAVILNQQNQGSFDPKSISGMNILHVVKSDQDMGSSNIEELPSVLPIFAKAANGTQVELCRFDLFFRMSLAILQAGYVGTCKYHPSGCFQIDKERHILLTESMLKTWAILTATDKSINRDELPEFKELPEFWHENAVYIQHKNRK